MMETAFNRTRLELKLQKRWHRSFHFTSFNRTRLELKHVINTPLAVVLELLIVPGWN